MSHKKANYFQRKASISIKFYACYYCISLTFLIECLCIYGTQIQLHQTAQTSHQICLTPLQTLICLLQNCILLRRKVNKVQQSKVLCSFNGSLRPSLMLTSSLTKKSLLHFTQAVFQFQQDNYCQSSRKRAGVLQSHLRSTCHFSIKK